MANVILGDKGVCIGLSYNEAQDLAILLGHHTSGILHELYSELDDHDIRAGDDGFRVEDGVVRRKNG